MNVAIVTAAKISTEPIAVDPSRSRGREHGQDGQPGEAAAPKGIITRGQTLNPPVVLRVGGMRVLVVGAAAVAADDLVPGALDRRAELQSDADDHPTEDDRQQDVGAPGQTRRRAIFGE